MSYLYLYESAEHHHCRPSTVSTTNAPPSLAPSADISTFESRRLTRSLARRCCGARSYDFMLFKMWDFRGGRKRSYLRVPTPPAAPVLVVCYGQVVKWGVYLRATSSRLLSTPCQPIAWRKLLGCARAPRGVCRHRMSLFSTVPYIFPETLIEFRQSTYPTAL